MKPNPLTKTITLTRRDPVTTYRRIAKGADLINSQDIEAFMTAADHGNIEIKAIGREDNAGQIHALAVWRDVCREKETPFVELSFEGYRYLFRVKGES